MLSRSGRMTTTSDRLVARHRESARTQGHWCSSGLPPDTEADKEMQPRISRTTRASDKEGRRKRLEQISIPHIFRGFHVEDLQDECPLGKLAKPSMRNEFDRSRHISHETRVAPPRTRSPSPPTVNSAMRDRSGSQSASRSGLGFPTSAFNP